eukprot:scaffold453_cov243-Pinguiococcus_pyrenoidosus.AAC.2
MAAVARVVEVSFSAGTLAPSHLSTSVGHLQVSVICHSGPRLGQDHDDALLDEEPLVVLRGQRREEVVAEPAIRPGPGRGQRGQVPDEAVAARPDLGEEIVCALESQGKDDGIAYHRMTGQLFHRQGAHRAARVRLPQMLPHGKLPCRVDPHGDPEVVRLAVSHVVLQDHAASHEQEERRHGRGRGLLERADGGCHRFPRIDRPESLGEAEAPQLPQADGASNVVLCDFRGVLVPVELAGQNVRVIDPRRPEVIGVHLHVVRGDDEGAPQQSHCVPKRLGIVDVPEGGAIAPAILLPTAHVQD